MSDLSDYQSAETAWRYDSRMERAEHRIKRLIAELETARLEYRDLMEGQVND